jgi:hypothetical protein
MKKFEKIIGVAILAMTIVTPLATLAQGVPSPLSGINGPAITNYTSLSQTTGTLTYVVNWIITIFWILTVLFLIWAAVLYLTAGGEEEKVGEAKKRVIGAIISAAIALLATALGPIVQNLLAGH